MKEVIVIEYLYACKISTNVQKLVMKMRFSYIFVKVIVMKI